jgi:hypothetical protein
MMIQAWLGLPASLTALGVGLLTLGVGRWLNALWASLARRRLWRVLSVAAADTGAEPLPPEELFNIPPLAPWMALGIGLGLGVSRVLLHGPLRLVGLAGGIVPVLWKQQRIQVGRQQLQREVADLIDTLRIYLAFAVTAGAALLLAIDEPRSGILWRRLRHHRDTVYIAGPDVALEMVATELESADLAHLLARMKATRAGATGMTAALRAVAAEMTAELQQELGEQVEGAPTRLIVPLLVTLMPPMLVLLLSPALQAFLDTLAGVGPVPLGR